VPSKAIESLSAHRATAGLAVSLLVFVIVGAAWGLPAAMAMGITAAVLSGCINLAITNRQLIARREASDAAHSGETQRDAQLERLMSDSERGRAYLDQVIPEVVSPVVNNHSLRS
jgi:hypothetical protein